MESGEIRVIAQGLLKRDTTTFPDVPTVYETPGLDFEKYGTPFITHRGTIAPADVPESMLQMWDQLLAQVTTDPEWVAWVAKRFVLPAEYIMNGQQLTEFMRNNTAIVRKVYGELNLGN
jgi:tripartite-type tricarboxylate transporter receptor subunit TctC